jgi:hypothetical protein
MPLVAHWEKKMHGLRSFTRRQGWKKSGKLSLPETPTDHDSFVQESKSESKTANA